MASKARPSFVKRQRERDQKQRRKLKDERRMERRALRSARSDAPGVDAPDAIEVVTETAMPPAGVPADTA